MFFRYAAAMLPLLIVRHAAAAFLLPVTRWLRDAAADAAFFFCCCSRLIDYAAAAVIDVAALFRLPDSSFITLFQVVCFFCRRDAYHAFSLH